MYRKECPDATGFVYVFTSVYFFPACSIAIILFKYASHAVEVADLIGSAGNLWSQPQITHLRALLPGQRDGRSVSLIIRPTFHLLLFLSFFSSRRALMLCSLG